MLETAFSVWQNCFCRAFRLANAAVDAFIGVDDEHVVAFIKAIHRTYFNAVHIFAADAGIGNDISHLRNSPIVGRT